MKAWSSHEPRAMRALSRRGSARHLPSFMRNVAIIILLHNESEELDDWIKGFKARGVKGLLLVDVEHFFQSGHMESGTKVVIRPEEKKHWELLGSCVTRRGKVIRWMEDYGVLHAKLKKLTPAHRGKDFKAKLQKIFTDDEAMKLQSSEAERLEHEVTETGG
eukprot:1876982-Amphidinium_carterae.1